MKVSIITINYNNATGLKKTIESVVSQSYRNFEYIIIDGGSTDSSVEVITAFSDNISYWVSERDKGIYHAMNKGIEQISGDYCIFMNSGDCFYDNDVLKRIDALSSKKDIIVGKVFDSLSDNLLFPSPDREISLYHLYSNTIPHQGAFIKSSLQKKYKYDESLRIVADWKFFVQAIIFDDCSIEFIDSPVALFDTEGVSFANRNATWEEKKQVMCSLFPKRILSDYSWMKASECKTRELTPQLKINYSIDCILYKIGHFLLRLKNYIKA